MKFRLRLPLSLIIIALLAGCGSGGPKRDINDPTNSLVIGYIDMDDAPTSAQTVTVMQVAPPTEAPYWEYWVSKGMFYNAHIPPASYQLSSVSGTGFIAGKNRYNFPRQGNSTNLRITKPGIYFLGSFKYKKAKTGIFEQGKFEIEKVNKPTETDLLKRILEEDSDIKKSAWANKIRARLAELNP